MDLKSKRLQLSLKPINMKIEHCLSKSQFAFKSRLLQYIFEAIPNFKTVNFALINFKTTPVQHPCKYSAVYGRNTIYSPVLNCICIYSRLTRLLVTCIVLNTIGTVLQGRYCIRLHYCPHWFSLQSRNLSIDLLCSQCL